MCAVRQSSFRVKPLSLMASTAEQNRMQPAGDEHGEAPSEGAERANEARLAFGTALRQVEGACRGLLRATVDRVGRAGGGMASRARAGGAFLASRLAPWLGTRAYAAFAAMRRGMRNLQRRMVESALPWAGARGRSAAQGAATFARETALPWLATAGQRLRQRLRPSRLRQDYRALLLALHVHLLDREVDSLLFVRARRDRNCTPTRLFAWAMEAIPEPVNRFAFVHIGSGRGRDLLLASAHPFERVIGVEPEPGLHSDCQMNIAQYPRSRMKCRDVDCVHDLLSRFPLPDQEAVFYLFRPDAAVLAKLIERVGAAYRRRPRRVYVVAVGIDDTLPLEESGFLQPLALERPLALKIRLLSPYTVAIYRSLA